MKDNAMNTFLAHEARVGNDINFVRGIIDEYTFVGFGTVKAYTNEHVTVSCGEMTFTNVEVMVLGVNGWGIKPVPAVNDRVMLFTTQTPVPDIKAFSASGSMPAYDLSGLKALPVTDSAKATQLITVDKDKVQITGNNKLTVNADGVQFEDAKGNKVTTDNNGVAFEDKNGNKITTTNSGVAFEDKNKNKITTSDSGVVFEDTNKNKVTTSDSGVAFEDKNSNKITTSSTGIAVEDKNHNKYTSNSSGITIEDKGGCKIVSDGTSTKINGNLEIKK